MAVESVACTGAAVDIVTEREGAAFLAVDFNAADADDGAASGTVGE